MFKVIFGFIFVVTAIFSEDKLEFQIQNVKNKKIEVLLTRSMKNNEVKFQVYQIQSGDTLSELSLKLNNDIDTLIELNNIKNKNLIITNEKLKYIEKKGEKNEI